MPVQQYNSYYQAEQAAKETSIKHPGIGWFVNWVEDDCWEISIFADYTDQDCYINGQLIQHEWED